MKRILVYILIVAIALTSLISLAACNRDTDDFKVGVVHIGDPAHPGYTQAHDNGIKAMQQELGLKDSQIVRKLEIADGDPAAIRTAIEDLIVQGCKLIFGTSFGYGQTMLDLAEEYPEIIFSHATGYMQADNMNNYFGRIYQARYLSGIVAGMKTQTNKLGYVSAYGTEIAETCSGINAFALGAAAVNPAITVDVRILNSWYDPTNEKAAAEALIEAGCDVITQHCDTSNPQIAAEEAGAGVYGIGYNSDMTADAPNSHLAATVWDWGVYYTKATREAMKCFEGGTFDVTPWKEFGNYYGEDDLGSGFVGLSPLTANAAAGTQERIDLVKELIMSGEWDVFSGVALSFETVAGVLTVVQTDRALTTNTATVIVPAGGASVSDGVIQGTMNYFVYNVNNTTP